MWNAFSSDGWRGFIESVRQESADLMEAVSRNLGDGPEEAPDLSSGEDSTPASRRGRGRRTPRATDGEDAEDEFAFCHTAAERQAASERRTRDDEAVLATAPVWAGDEGMSAVVVRLFRLRARLGRLSKKVARADAAAQAAAVRRECSSSGEDKQDQEKEEVHHDHGDEEYECLDHQAIIDLPMRRLATELQRQHEKEVCDLQRDAATFLTPLHATEWMQLQRELFVAKRPSEEKTLKEVVGPQHRTQKATMHNDALDPDVLHEVTVLQQLERILVPFGDTNNWLYCYGASLFPWGEGFDVEIEQALQQELHRPLAPSTTEGAVDATAPRASPFTRDALPSAASTSFTVPPALRLVVENSCRGLQERLCRSSHHIRLQLQRYGTSKRCCRSSAARKPNNKPGAATTTTTTTTTGEDSNMAKASSEVLASEDSKDSLLPPLPLGKVTSREFFTRYFVRLFLLRVRQWAATQSQYDVLAETYQRQREVAAEARRQQRGLRRRERDEDLERELSESPEESDDDEDEEWESEEESDDDEDEDEADELERVVTNAAAETFSGLFQGFQHVVGAVIPHLFLEGEGDNGDEQADDEGEDDEGNGAMPDRAARESRGGAIATAVPPSHRPTSESVARHQDPERLNTAPALSSATSRQPSSARNATPTTFGAPQQELHHQRETDGASPAPLQEESTSVVEAGAREVITHPAPRQRSPSPRPATDTVQNAVEQHMTNPSLRATSSSLSVPSTASPARSALEPHTEAKMNRTISWERPPHDIATAAGNPITTTASRSASRASAEAEGEDDSSLPSEDELFAPLSVLKPTSSKE